MTWGMGSGSNQTPKFCSSCMFLHEVGTDCLKGLPPVYGYLGDSATVEGEVRTGRKWGCPKHRRVE
jgi:hypothetical protein